MVLVRGTCRRCRQCDPGGAGSSGAHGAAAQLAQHATLWKLQLAGNNPGVVRLDYLIAGGFEERDQPAHRCRFCWCVGSADGGECGVDIEVEEWLSASDDG